MTDLLFEELTKKMIGAAIEVHKNLGPGLLVSAYEKCLMYELVELGLKVDQQVNLPIQYKEMDLDCYYRLDLVLEDKIIIELKAVEQLTKVHEAQLITYLKLSKFRVRMLINFNEDNLINGLIRRILQIKYFSVLSVSLWFEFGFDEMVRNLVQTFPKIVVSEMS